MQSKFDLRLYHIFLSGVKPLDANCKMLIQNVGGIICIFVANQGA
jgi:hypothetical protein